MENITQTNMNHDCKAKAQPRHAARSLTAAVPPPIAAVPWGAVPDTHAGVAVRR